MVDSVAKEAGRFAETSAKGFGLQKGTVAAEKALERKTIRTGKTKTEREAKQAIQKQAQTEAAALAEADDEIARRKAVAGSKRTGRGSLIRSTGSGTATNLGGTA